MTNSTWSRYIIILIYSWIFCFARAVCECTGFLELQCAGATLCCGAQGSRCSGFSCCGSKGSRLVGTRCQQLWHTSSVVVACRLQSMGLLVVVPGLSCSTACGIFLDQGLNPCPLHWQTDFKLLDHQGSPRTFTLNMKRNPGKGSPTISLVVQQLSKAQALVSFHAYICNLMVTR